MIICGFPGTGKSTMARFTKWIDLESTPFEKDWKRYAKVAKHMSDSGYTVMVSTHKELLKELEQIEVSYTVIIPPISDKEIYLRRYEMRGNSHEFMQFLEDNWERWICNILYEPSVLKTLVVLPEDGCIMAYAKGIGEV